MPKNITYITGNNSFAVAEAVAKWREVFTTKYSPDNIELMTLEKKDFLWEFQGKIMMSWLFSEKRLFLIRWGAPTKWKKWGSWLEEVLEKIKDQIPEDHFLLFYDLSPKEEWLITWLNKNTEIKSMNTLWHADYWMQRFDKIPAHIIRSILTRYESIYSWEQSNDILLHLGHKIANTLELVSLSGKESIESFIHEWPSIGDFDLSNAVQDGNTLKALQIVRKEHEKKDAQKILTGLIWQMRNTLYIKYLQAVWYNKDSIAKTIQVHPFVLKKTLERSITSSKISHFFSDLIRLDRRYKSGKGIKDGELWRIFAIERAIFWLKK